MRNRQRMFYLKIMRDIEIIPPQLARMNQKPIQNMLVFDAPTIADAKYTSP